MVAELQAQGLDIVALQRTDRSGFKGGALHEAMQKTAYDYFAIFDVDYVPSTDFLRVCMRPFFAEPRTAFVQARFDFLNPHQNALTEMQMVTLDAHLGIEQATRCWAGHPLPFNGTCGIWQRAAIEAGGGWKGDTVTEDLDLTYRGWVKGWRALFLTSVAVPGELPADTKTWLRQQQRWQDGFRHVSLRMAPAILRSRDITLSAKAAALLHLCMSLNQPVLLVGVVSGLLAAVLAPSLVPLLLTLFLLTLVWVLFCATTFLRAGHNFIRHGEMSPLHFTLVLARFVGGASVAEFHAFLDTEKDKTELRLLPKPLYRYCTNQPNLPDCALFAFVLTTDPEVLLAIEARPVDGKVVWHYGFARMSMVNLRARHKDRDVWRVDWAFAFQDPNEPYVTLRVVDRPD